VFTVEISSADPSGEHPFGTTSGEGDGDGDAGAEPEALECDVEAAVVLVASPPQAAPTTSRTIGTSERPHLQDTAES
jgi:hypothetical protein